jgi:hypothetical protein
MGNKENFEEVLMQHLKSANLNETQLKGYSSSIMGLKESGLSIERISVTPHLQHVKSGYYPCEPGDHCNRMNLFGRMTPESISNLGIIIGRFKGVLNGITVFPYGIPNIDGYEVILGLGE